MSLEVAEKQQDLEDMESVAESAIVPQPVVVDGAPVAAAALPVPKLRTVCSSLTCAVARALALQNPYPRPHTPCPPHPQRTNLKLVAFMVLTGPGIQPVVLEEVQDTFLSSGHKATRFLASQVFTSFDYYGCEEDRAACDNHKLYNEMLKMYKEGPVTVPSPKWAALWPSHTVMPNAMSFVVMQEKFCPLYIGPGKEYTMD
jgi:hypothetical protein